MTDVQRKADKGAFAKSIHHTLMHMVLADKMWLAKFAGQGVAFVTLHSRLIALPEGADYLSNQHLDWEDLKQTRERLEVAMEVWLQAMSHENLSGTMRYTNTKGIQRAFPAWQALTHFFHHLARHRGRMATLLMQARVDVGIADLIALV